MRYWFAALFAFAASSDAMAQRTPSMVTLSTGSEVATWSLAPDQPKFKTPVIFLHGGPGMYTEDRRFDDGAILRAAGFSTIYFDQVGGGKSKRLPASAYTITRAVDDLEALRTKLGQDRLILWGNSWGSTLATLYADRYPDKVAGLILTSPGTFPGTNPPRNYKVTNRDKVVLGKEISRSISTIDKKGAAAEATISQEQSGKWFDEVLAAELIEGMVCKGTSMSPAALPGGGNIYANRLMLKQVEKLAFKPVAQPKRPVLILRGSCDFLVAANAGEYAKHFGVPVTTIEGTGHGMLEKRDVVDKAIGAFANGPLASIE